MKISLFSISGSDNDSSIHGLFIGGSEGSPSSDSDIGEHDTKSESISETLRPENTEEGRRRF